MTLFYKWKAGFHFISELASSPSAGLTPTEKTKVNKSVFKQKFRFQKAMRMRERVTFMES